MTRTENIPALTHRHIGNKSRPHFAVLIEVPKVKDASASSLTSWRTARVRQTTRGRRAGRRRLKREFRLAGWLCIVGMSIAASVSSFGTNHSGNIARTDLIRKVDPDDGRISEKIRPVATHDVTRSGLKPAVVLMSIEPAQVGTKPELDPPVIFPGYLLPDDSLEEKAHEGS